MSDALAARRALYLDANPIIYALDGVPEVAVPIQAFLTKLRATDVSVVTSELTLAEVLSKKNLLPARRKEYLDLLVFARWIDLWPVDRPILYDAARIRGLTSHKLVDAMHLSTAIAANCQFLMSKDGDFKSMPTGMRQITPDSQGIAEFLEATS